MTRRYAAEIFPLIGPNKDVPAPDVGTDAQVMAWIIDNYSQQVGYAVPSVVTGKPYRLAVASAVKNPLVVGSSMSRWKRSAT